MKSRIAVVGLITLVAITGCNTAGPKGLKSGRVLYNEVLRYTNNEQLLLNLVRLRYRDTPVALGVSNISTQYELSASASAYAGFPGDDGIDDYGASFGLSYSETPTISFTPLQGSAFVKEMLNPIKPEALFLLLQTGWEADRVTRCLVRGMNGVGNAVSASIPTPDAPPDYKDFQRAASLLRALQKRNRIEIGSGGSDETPTLIIELAETEVDSTEMQELARLLKLRPGLHEYELMAGVLPGEANQIAVDMRSMMGVLFFMSQGVDVPKAHEEKGLVTVTRNTDGSRFDWHDVMSDLLHVRTSKDRPGAAAVRLEYRGAWFYIADDDLSSKSTFVMLTQLSSLAAGSVPMVTPLLTLPLH